MTELGAAIKRDIRANDALRLRLTATDMALLMAGLATMPHLDRLRERIASWYESIDSVRANLDKPED